MSKVGIAVIAALLLAGCSGVVANPAAGEIIQGYTVEEGPACAVSDLSTESKALVTRWWALNQIAKDEITPEEFAEGSALFHSGKCGLLRGGVSVVIVLLDGTINLARFPDGTLMGFTSGSFVEGEKSYKEFR